MISNLNALDAFELARKLIEHENTLVSYRTNWFLAFQGLLFTAYFQAVSLLWKADVPVTRSRSNVLVFGLALSVCVSGVVSSLVAAFAVNAAASHISTISHWWTQMYPESSNYPALVGERGVTLGPIEVGGCGFLGAFAAVWAVLLFLLWFGRRR